MTSHPKTILERKKKPEETIKLLNEPHNYIRMTSQKNVNFDRLYKLNFWVGVTKMVPVLCTEATENPIFLGTFLCVTFVTLTRLIIVNG